MKAVFIVGTGRSGTHFTVRLMDGFLHTRDPLQGNENTEVLRDIATAAIHHRLPSKSTEKYYADMLSETDGVILDQHHPNLFFVKHWQEKLGDLVFLYPQRPIYQIVASMMRHGGVMNWYNYAGKFRQRIINLIPYPNRFFGIEKFSDIKRLPVHILCAHRVIAHRLAFEQTVPLVNNALRLVNYEELVKDPMSEFARIFTPKELEKLGQFTLTETPNQTAFAKYLDVLTDDQVRELVALEDVILAKVNI